MLKDWSRIAVVATALLAAFLCKDILAGQATVGWVEERNPTNSPEQGDTGKPSMEEFIQKTQTLRMPFIANNGQMDEQVRFHAKTFGGTVFVTKEGDIVYSLPSGRDVPAGASQQGGKVVLGWHGQAPLVRAESAFVAAGFYSPLLRADNAHGSRNNTFAQSRLAAYLPRLQKGMDTLVETTRRVVSASSLLPNSDSNVVPATYHPHSEIQNPQSPIGGVALKEHLVGGKIGEINGDAQSVTKVSYFKGNDPSKWKSNVSTYEVVDMGEVYDGISLSLKAYSNNVEKLFTIMPNANPEAIKLGLSGAKALEVNKEGQLEVETELGIVTFSKPVAYQEVDGKRVCVAVEYGIRKSRIGGQEAVVGGIDAVAQGGTQNPKPETRNSKLIYGFKVASYDKSRELVIDPLLASTFLGGDSGDIGRSLTRDADGNIYVAGETDSLDFPVTPGAYRATRSAGTDMFVSKFSGDLKTLLVSAIIGGSDEDVATGVAVSISGDIYITGYTRSTDFPVQGAYDATFNGGKSDIVIAKFSGDLARLPASTYLGGAGEACNVNCSIDDYASSVKIAPDQSVVVAGYTFSSNFPVTKGAFDNSYDGYADGIVSVLSSDLRSLMASTYLGGYGGDSIGGYYLDDFGDALAIDSKGNIYAGGTTGSLNFPVTTDAYDRTPMVQGDDDAFVTRFNSTLTSVLASTFLGGDKRDAVCALSLGSGGEVYVTGFTESHNFPTTNGAYDRTYNGKGGYQDDDIFVSKLDMNLSKLMASTFLGGSYTDRSVAMVVDTLKNVFVAGRTCSDEAKMSDYPTTPGAFDRGFDQSIGSDGVLSKLSGDLSKLMASTFLGGAQGEEDRPHALAADAGGGIYVTGKTYSSDFPITLGSYDECFGGFYDAFVAKLDGNLSTSLPLVTTGRADVLSGTSAELKGIVNANGLPTKTWVEYGTKKGVYDKFSWIKNVTGFTDTPLSFFVNGLLPKVKYYYRLAAQSGAGVSYGDEKRFVATDLPGEEITIQITRIIPSGSTFGSPITIEGKINPPPGKSSVYLFFESTGGLSDDQVIEITSTDGSFTLANYFPPAGGEWAVTAILKEDKSHNDVISEPKKFTVGQAEISLTIVSSSYLIDRDGEVDITGEITVVPNNVTTRNGLLNETLKLVRIDPQGGYEDVLEVCPFSVGGKMLYKFCCVKLPQTGTWKLLVGLDEDVSFKRSFTEKIGIMVKTPEEEVAGYAILVEGRVEGNSGIDSHNRTTNDIYQKLLGRGFSEEDIFYFNFYIDQEGVDEKPTMEGVKNAIETWASVKMNAKPAPLYVVMVGHGAKDVFPISPGLISASALSEAISVLESKLSENPEASKKTIVVIVGTNHSGSFIEDISKPNTNRIVITSSDAEEVAYKGPLAPDEDIRQGDYFVSEFFRFAAMDMTVKKSYEAAVRAIASFTENANGNGLGGGNAGNGRYIDKVAQHPLLDDNGDGGGTYGVLSSYDGLDGALSSTLMVGKTTGGTSLELTQISDTITLGVGNETPILFAKVNDTERVNAMWVEVASPHHALEYLAGATEQQVIELPRFGYDYFDESEGKFVWKDYSEESEFDNFRTGGEYEVFYFGRDGLTGDITTLQESDVFKATVGNRAPGEFCIISPTPGEETKISLLFDWSDSVDADEDEVEYNLTLSRDIDFATIDYEVRGLNQSWALVDKAAALEDQKPYYWRVLAYDGKGGTRYMGGPCSAGKSNKVQGIVSSTFTPLLTSGFAGQLLMNIRNDKNNTAVVGAIPTVYLPAATDGPPTDGTGTSMFPLLNAGTYKLGLKCTGYKNAMESVQLYPNTVSYYVIAMTRKKK